MVLGRETRRRVDWDGAAVAGLWMLCKQWGGTGRTLTRNGRRRGAHSQKGGLQRQTPLHSQKGGQQGGGRADVEHDDDDNTGFYSACAAVICLHDAPFSRWRVLSPAYTVQPAAVFAAVLNIVDLVSVEAPDQKFRLTVQMRELIHAVYLIGMKSSLGAVVGTSSHIHLVAVLVLACVRLVRAR